MFRIVSAALIALLLSAPGAFSQLQLHRIYSRSVSEGYSVNTIIDSLMIDTRVNSGVAVSRVTMVLVPDTVDLEKVTALKDPALDSIEISTSFQLPSDFVADSMWLWVEGEAVPAYIQDRALASQQYREIVGVRRDPALLETWGRGYYNLRIFPATSLESRKICIEFRHTFDDDTIAGGTPLMTACVPVIYDSLYARAIYYSATPALKSIGTVAATVTVDDRTTYTVDLPGVGSGEAVFGAPLTLVASSVVKLDVGTIAAEDPSAGDELLWTGRDADGTTATAGLSFTLSDAIMRFDDPPDTRIIMIDMRNEVWDWNDYYAKRAEAYGYTYTPNARYEKVNIMDRARKYAVLALQQYLEPGQKFNVLIGGESVHKVFDAPVKVSDGNLEKAVLAIVEAQASPSTSTEELLAEAVEQAPEGITVLITDLFQPADYQIRVDNTYEKSSSGMLYDSLMLRLDAMVKEAGTTLFTIDDNYQLYRVALESGGFRLSGILNRYNIAFHYEVVDGRRIMRPDLPPLFGSMNRSGMRDLTITSEGLSDIAYTVDGYYNGIYYTTMRGDIAINEEVVRTDALAKMVLPNTSNGDNAFVRVAGTIDIGGTDRPVTLSVRGKTGGLWFSAEMTAKGFYLPSTSSYRPYVDPQWAYRTAEQLAFDDLVGNAVEIKRLGKEYHIVTRQTSLLALEPGMELWEDSSWQQEEQNNVVTTGSAETAILRDATSDYTAEGGAPTSTTATGSGIDLDGVSLDDLLMNRIAVVADDAGGLQRGLTVRAAGSLLMITLPTEKAALPVQLNVFDLKGRQVYGKTIMPHELKGSRYAWNMKQAGNRLGAGMYTVKVSAGTHTGILRITLTGR